MNEDTEFININKINAIFKLTRQRWGLSIVKCLYIENKQSRNTSVWIQLYLVCNISIS